MRITGDTPLWVAARCLLGSRVDDFCARWKKVLKSFDAEDIHDLRVSSRRLREGLQLFAPTYRSRDHGRAERRVRAVTRLLGAMRNTDEALQFFRELSAELDGNARIGLARLIAKFEAHREKERQRLQQRLGALDCAKTHAMLTGTVARPLILSQRIEGIDPFMTLASFAALSLAARVDDVLALVPEARQEEAVDAQHRLRIAIKHYRYRMEILSFLIGDGFSPLHGIIKEYQEILGKMHDMDVFAAIINDAAMPTEAAQPILAAIAMRRHDLFASFSRMLELHPFEGIGELIGAAL